MDDRWVLQTMNDPAVRDGYASARIGYAWRNGADTVTLVDAAETAYRTIAAEAGVQLEAAE